MKKRKSATCALALVLAITSGVSPALTTDKIIESTPSVDCLDWRVVGVCFWLFCTQFGCSVRTSIKVRHYVPDAVVSSYANTGENPWEEVREMSSSNSDAAGGQDGTTNEQHENNLAKFRNADVIGHPGEEVFKEFAESFGYICKGASTMFFPYLLSTLDTLAWRHNIPESFFPPAWIPGLREISSLEHGTWGNVYPRGGFLHQVDDYKAAAVVAQRAGDVVTRKWQIHIYWPLRGDEEPGYWPAGDLIEGDIKTGKWQELTPTLSETCAVFPHGNVQDQATKADYAWALWRPYACCKREGQVFLFSIDTEESSGSSGSSAGSNP